VYKHREGLECRPRCLSYWAFSVVALGGLALVLYLAIPPHHARDLTGPSPPLFPTSKQPMKTAWCRARSYFSNLYLPSNPRLPLSLSLTLSACRILGPGSVIKRTRGSRVSRTVITWAGVVLGAMSLDAGEWADGRWGKFRGRRSFFWHRRAYYAPRVAARHGAWKHVRLINMGMNMRLFAIFTGEEEGERATFKQRSCSTSSTRVT
jgi:hypothetical protein